MNKILIHYIVTLMYHDVYIHHQKTLLSVAAFSLIWD